MLFYRIVYFRISPEMKEKERNSRETKRTTTTTHRNTQRNNKKKKRVPLRTSGNGIRSSNRVHSRKHVLRALWSLLFRIQWFCSRHYSRLFGINRATFKIIFIFKFLLLFAGNWWVCASKCYSAIHSQAEFNCFLLIQFLNSI